MRIHRPLLLSIAAFSVLSTGCRANKEPARIDANPTRAFKAVVGAQEAFQKAAGDDLLQQYAYVAKEYPLVARHLMFQEIAYALATRVQSSEVRKIACRRMWVATKEGLYTWRLVCEKPLRPDGDWRCLIECLECMKSSAGMDLPVPLCDRKCRCVK